MDPKGLGTSEELIWTTGASRLQMCLDEAVYLVQVAEVAAVWG